MLGHVLEETCRFICVPLVKIYALSTEPFNAFESICFVLLKESMSFPKDESSSNCSARFTLLN